MVDDVQCSRRRCSSLVASGGDHTPWCVRSTPRADRCLPEAHDDRARLCRLDEVQTLVHRLPPVAPEHTVIVRIRDRIRLLTPPALFSPSFLPPRPEKRGTYNLSWLRIGPPAASLFLATHRQRAELPFADAGFSSQSGRPRREATSSS